MYCASNARARPCIRNVRRRRTGFRNRHVSGRGVNACGRRGVRWRRQAPPSRRGGLAAAAYRAVRMSVIFVLFCFFFHWKVTHQPPQAGSVRRVHDKNRFERAIAGTKKNLWKVSKKTQTVMGFWKQQIQTFQRT